MIGAPAGTVLFCDAANIKTNYADMTVLRDSTKWQQAQNAATDWDVQAPDQFTYHADVSWWDGARPYDKITGDYERLPMPLHQGGTNIAFCDGHAKWMKIEQLTGIGQFSRNAPTVKRDIGWEYGDPENLWDDK